MGDTMPRRDSEDKETIAKKKINPERKQQYITLVACLSLTVVCTLQMGIGFWANKTVDNMAAGAFWASSLVVVGVLVASCGVCSMKQGHCAISAGVAFLILGLAVIVIGAIIDSFAARAVMDIDFSQCGHSSTGYANCTHLYPCHVQLAWPDICYCCHLTGMRHEQCYFRHMGLTHSPSIFAGVQSCDQVSGMYVRLLWTSVALCILSFIMTVVLITVICIFKRKVLSSDVKYTPPAANRTHRIEEAVHASPLASSSSTTYAFPSQPPSAPPQHVPQSSPPALVHQTSQSVMGQSHPAVVTHVRASITSPPAGYHPAVITSSIPYTVSVAAPQYHQEQPPPAYM